MKKLIKPFIILAVAAAMCLGAAGAALANVVYDGSTIVIEGDGGYTDTDLFGGFKNVMPGDDIEHAVTFANEGSSTINVYLKAQAHDDENKPVYDEEADIASMNDFLSGLTLEILDGETREQLYESAPEASVDPNRPAAPDNPEGEGSGQGGQCGRDRRRGRGRGRERFRCNG